MKLHRFQSRHTETLGPDRRWMQSFQLSESGEFMRALLLVWGLGVGIILGIFFTLSVIGGSLPTPENEIDQFSSWESLASGK